MDLLGIPGDVLADRSGWAIAGVFVLLMALGRLIPRSSHTDRVDDKNSQIADLKETIKVKDEQIRVRDEQVAKLLPNTELTVHLLQELAREAGRRDLAS
ncbi:hypothetical protein ACN27B_08775 [Micromonospora sp. WMMD754]|uniref:hypothetical protein n=1 Tax=Micromonospora sp. WMMD754 TaxID=3404114 RepID=UPI003BF56916